MFQIPVISFSPFNNRSSIAVASVVGLGLLVCARPIFAGQINTSLSFPQPTMVTEGQYSQVYLQDAWNTGEAGAPSLPVKAIWLALPSGEHAVSAELRGEVWKSLPGTYRIAPNPEPRPLSDLNPPSSLTEDPRIYGGNEPYPPSPLTGLNTHLKRGFAVATCLIHPVRWDPATSMPEYLAQAELFVSTKPGELEQIAYERFYRGDRQTREWLDQRVRNPHILGSYPRRDEGELEGLLVITDEAFLEAAQEYAGWRQERGTPVDIAKAADLVAVNDGDDDQERIRAGIIAAYENQGIASVLLLGDDEQIPHRGCWGEVGETIDNDVANDWYYAGLDGRWNRDRDDLWGEANESDLLAEVTIGRLPVGSAEEARRALAKVMLYCDAPVVDDVLKVLMVGEYLGWANTGGDYMDEVYRGSNNWGYTTEGFPHQFDRDRQNLYDEDYGPDGWSARDDFEPLISAGYHFIHHLGHANTENVMKFGSWEVTDELFTNDGEANGLNVVYSQGCYCGAFDNRDEGGNYVGECIAEAFIHDLTGGFVAFICNSRYGWGSGENTNGASQRFQREYVDAMFGEGHTVIGYANQSSKEDVAPYCDETVLRWCFYDTNLLGDPTMDIWTDVPNEFEIEYSDEITLGETTCSIDADVPGAAVCISCDGDIMSAGATDDSGAVTLEFPEPVHELTPLKLTVTAHDYLPFTADLQIVRPANGFPWVQALEITDPDGNNNGVLDYGESVELIPTVCNLGLEAINRLTLTAETDDPYITVNAEGIAYQAIAPDETGEPEELLSLTAARNCPDGYRADLTLTLTVDAEHQWRQTVTVTVHAPRFSEPTFVIGDADFNRNGILEPGEVADLTIQMANSGSGQADSVTAVLDTESPMLQLERNEISVDIVPAGEPVSFDAPFRLSVADDCPNPYRSVFYVRLTAARGFGRSFLIDQGIGGMACAFERDQDLPEHEALVGGNDQWHLSTENNTTPGGAHSLKVGSDQPDGHYIGFLNCVAYLPEFNVMGPTELTFHHKISAECRDSSNLAFDGGFVEVSADGGAWETIEPYREVGHGYPCEILHGRDRNLLADGQGCYSGELDWAPAIFSLSDFEGQTIRIRFHFASDSTGNRHGWWIDDVELRLPTETEAPYDLTGEIAGRGAQLWWHSPDLYRDELPEPNLLWGYRIYRNGDLLDTLATDNRYFDDLVGQRRGDYDYLVFAEYSTGESAPSNPITIYWSADAPVNPALLPAELTLESVYPNPFNRQVRVNYALPTAGELRLAVYDLTGREVAVLVNGWMDAGSHLVIMNATMLPSGIYFIKLRSGNVIKTAKLVQMR